MRGRGFESHTVCSHWRDNEEAVGADLVVIGQAGSGCESPNLQTRVSYLLRFVSSVVEHLIVYLGVESSILSRTAKHVGQLLTLRSSIAQTPLRSAG